MPKSEPKSEPKPTADQVHDAVRRIIHDELGIGDARLTGLLERAFDGALRRIVMQENDRMIAELRQAYTQEITYGLEDVQRTARDEMRAWLETHRVEAYKADAYLGELTRKLNELSGTINSPSIADSLILKAQTELIQRLNNLSVPSLMQMALEAKAKAEIAAFVEANFRVEPKPVRKLITGKPPTT